MKPDILHLCVFGASCAVISPKEWLKGLEDRATMCFLVGYKYDGGGYRVWDLKKQGGVEFGDIVFFVEDGLPSPTLNDLPPRPVDEGESVT